MSGLCGPNPPIKIRKALPGDAAEIYRVHTAAIQKKCASHYTDEQVENWVGRQEQAHYVPFIEKGEIIVAESGTDGKVLGFGQAIPDTILHQEGDPVNDAVQIRGLFVDPSCGSRGIGSALMQHMEEAAAREGAKTLTVHSSLNAVDFYRKCGFTPLEVLSHLVSRGGCLQCMKMTKTL